MSLAEASEARKARLTALRKRKAGETVDEEGYVSSRQLTNISYDMRLISFLYYIEMQNLS